MELAVVMLVLERPRRDFRTRGLSPHVLKDFSPTPLSIARNPMY